MESFLLDHRRNRLTVNCNKSTYVFALRSMRRLSNFAGRR